ncbi:MAG: uncharacterized protein KVP18_003329 [Porospora cf. gigantea A]|uniref:uncharacterized protein n=1 Tax=Porospora cf. gigantea A TaxID=2853593 RepID=UPI003559DA18|nr:MAG: hypothetical protein KVP18_003329 [Porospora cf. gigantea A]
MTDEPLSKNQLKKLEKEKAKEAEKALKAAKVEAERDAAAAIMNKQADSLDQAEYGYLPLIQSSTTTTRVWTSLSKLTEVDIGKDVWIRARIHESRCKGAIGFVVLREKLHTLQGVLDGNKHATRDMIKWAGGVPLESVCDFFGRVVAPDQPVSGCSKSHVELEVKQMLCVTKSLPQLPFMLKDANLPEASAEGSSVGQDVRLDNRILDLRTFASQAIFRVQSKVCELFRGYLLQHEFMEIHSPKLLGGQSEGGTNVFTLKYFDRPACLAQSPQLYKQMALSGDFDRVFEIGPVFRAENSNTHRHLCEFTGLDVEMTFKEHYYEVLDEFNSMFKYIFKGLTEQCSEEAKIIQEQFGVEPFVWVEDAPRLDFAEGIAMLREAGADVPGPDDIFDYDLDTVNEKKLGKLVKEKYGTDFYMLVRYPLAVRPFYSMPDPKDIRLSNSYDFFMRGEEIVSGAQRIHEPVYLAERALACGMDVAGIQSYIDAFSLGAYPHAGCGVGLERVVMLFLGLKNIRKSCLFPRDPKRLTP